MSETARRKIELVVEVNIEQSKRALRSVTEEADKVVKDSTTRTKKAQKDELDAYGASSRQIVALAQETARARNKATQDALRDARKAYDAEAEAARKAAEEKKRIEREAADAAKAASDAEREQSEEKKKNSQQLAIALKVVAAAYTAIYVANTALDWAKEGAQINALNRSYANIGFTAKDLDATMAKLGYTLDTATVQRMSNLAHSFGFGQKEIQRFAEIARAASVKTGQDIKWMFESIVTGTARQSRLILDNLGILIKVGDAQEKYAKKLGFTADALNDVQKKQAFVNEVMAQGQKIINDAPVDPLTQKIGRMSSQWTELGNQIKVTTAHLLNYFAEAYGPHGLGTGNYVSENLSRADQSKVRWQEQYRAVKALTAQGADAVYSAFGEDGEIEKLLDLADANKELADKVLAARSAPGTGHGTWYEQQRADAAKLLLERLKFVEETHWRAIQDAERMAAIQKEELKWLADKQDLEMKIDELRGNGLSKQDEEAEQLKEAVVQLNKMVAARVAYNALIKRGVNAIAPGDNQIQGDPGKATPGGTAAKTPWYPVGLGPAPVPTGNDPGAPGAESPYYDNEGGQVSLGVMGATETFEENAAQKQEKTRKPGGGYQKKEKVPKQPWFPNMEWDDPAAPDRQRVLPLGDMIDFSEYEMAADKVKGIYTKMYDRLDEIAAESEKQRAEHRKQLLVDEYESNKVQLSYMQDLLDKGLYSAQGRDSDMADRDKALNRLVPDDRQKFEKERLSEWQKGASEAEFAWANFVDNAEPDRLKAIGDAIHENIAKPTQIAADALKDLANGFAQSTAAAIYEAKGLDAWKRLTNEFLKELSRKAAASAIYEGAAALASLAIGDVPGAALHGKASLAYGVVAVGFGIGAAATGGWQTHAKKDEADTATKKNKDRGGPAARTGDDGKMQQQISNVYYISYSGLSSDADVRDSLMGLLNSGVGSGGRIDSRIIEQR